MKQKNHKNRWGVILAGGDGTRLKTLTRAIAGDDRPKQFCPLVGDKTLLDQTQRRVIGLLGPMRTLTVVTRTHETFYEDQLKGWPRDLLLVQPDNKGTAPAILLSLLKISQLSPEAVLAFFPSDHYFNDEERFMSQVEVAFELIEAQTSGITLLGISPTKSEVQYGWIEPVISSRQQCEQILLPVRRFWEKPSRVIAERLMRGGALWNSFVMVGHVKAFLEIIFSTLPELFCAFSATQKVLGSSAEEQVLRKLYDQIVSTNFSREVLARRPTDLSVFKLNHVGWTDLGEPRRVVATIKSEKLDKESLPLSLQAIQT